MAKAMIKDLHPLLKTHISNAFPYGCCITSICKTSTEDIVENK
jgi:hypothetical protein